MGRNIIGMRGFKAFETKYIWRLIHGHGRLMCIKVVLHWQTPIFITWKWWSATPLANGADFYLNYYFDSCVGIIKVNICVAWFMYLHTCLLNYLCFCEYIGWVVIWFQRVRGLPRCGYIHKDRNHRNYN